MYFIFQSSIFSIIIRPTREHTVEQLSCDTHTPVPPNTSLLYVCIRYVVNLTQNEAVGVATASSGGCAP